MINLTHNFDHGTLDIRQNLDEPGRPRAEYIFFHFAKNEVYTGATINNDIDYLRRYLDDGEVDSFLAAPEKVEDCGDGVRVVFTDWDTLSFSVVLTPIVSENTGCATAPIPESDPMSASPGPESPHRDVRNAKKRRKARRKEISIKVRRSNDTLHENIQNYSTARIKYDYELLKAFSVENRRLTHAGAKRMYRLIDTIVATSVNLKAQIEEIIDADEVA